VVCGEICVHICVMCVCMCDVCWCEHTLLCFVVRYVYIYMLRACVCVVCVGVDIHLCVLW